MSAPPARLHDRWTVRELVLVAVVCTLLALVLTLPQAFQFSTGTGANYDSLFSIWRLSWIAHQLPLDPLRLFDTNIFYPEQHTLAYSDAILMQGLVAAPLLWSGVPAVVVYNLLILFSFTASGVAMYLCTRSAVGSQPAAWIAGLIFAFQPYRIAHFGHLELLWGFWIPLAFWAFQRVVATRRLRDGLLLGLCVTFQAWSSLYYGIFLVTALGVLAVVNAIGRRRADLVAIGRPVTVAACLCAVLVVPYALPYLDVREVTGGRSEAEIRQWSPTALSYITTTRENWLYGVATIPFGQDEEFVLFPGVVALGLACIGLWPPWTRRRAAYGVLLVVAFDLSLGFNGVIYRTLYSVLLPYQGLRVPARMFVVVSTVIALMAGCGLARVLGWMRSARWRAIVTAVAVAAVLAESLSVPVALRPVPAPIPRIYAWLKTQPTSVVMEWPLPHRSSLGITYAPVYMLYSTQHWQPLLNGYSGFHPRSYYDLIERMEVFPRHDTIGFLQRRGVRFIVLHSAYAPADYIGVRQQLNDRSDVRLVMTDLEGTHELALYELTGAPSSP